MVNFSELKGWLATLVLSPGMAYQEPVFDLSVQARGTFDTSITLEKAHVSTFCVFFLVHGQSGRLHMVRQKLASYPDDAGEEESSLVPFACACVNTFVLFIVKLSAI